MSDLTLQFSAQIDSAKANNDRTLTIKLETQELMPEETAHIFSLFQKQLWCCLSETSVTKEDLNIPEVIDPMRKKSPSQELRDLLYVLWKQNNSTGTSNQFDDYYKTYYNKLCDNIREKIN